MNNEFLKDLEKFEEDLYFMYTPLPANRTNLEPRYKELLKLEEMLLK